MLPASNHQPETAAQTSPEFGLEVLGEAVGENSEAVKERMDLPEMERALAGVLDLPRLSNATPEEMLQWLAERDPKLFFAAGIKRLELTGGLPSFRKRSLRVLDTPAFLVELVRSELFDNQGLLSFCADHVREDPLLDVKLARLMPGRQVDTYHLEPALILRILEVLDSISPGLRLLMIIGHLTQYTDRRVASKAALLVGRRLQSQAWIERHVDSPDARVRANVVEALWGRKSGLASRTLRKCLHDENNRVKGNAIVGLNLLGDLRVNWRIRQLAHDPRPAYRQTAAWVIGKVADPEFLSILEELLRDSTPAVREAAETAMQKFRQPELAPGTPEFNRNLALGAFTAPPPQAHPPNAAASVDPVVSGRSSQAEPGLPPAPSTPKNEPGKDAGRALDQGAAEPAFTLRLDGRYVTSG